MTDTAAPAQASDAATPDESATKRVLLAAPRGYCAGVDRAVVTVEKALDLYGPPVYVRKQIVHNKHVVTTLEKRGEAAVAPLAELRRKSANAEARCAAVWVLFRLGSTQALAEIRAAIGA